MGTSRRTDRTLNAGRRAPLLSLAARKRPSPGDRHRRSAGTNGAVAVRASPPIGNGGEPRSRGRQLGQRRLARSRTIWSPALAWYRMPALVNDSPRNVLVTGASSGLGRALALWFARRGAKVWAAARRAELLASLAEDPSARPGSIVPLVLDVGDIGAVRRVLPEVDAAAEGGLDVAIANAGVGGEANPRKDTWEK